MANARKKQFKATALPKPRALAEIQKEYDLVSNEAGRCQYQVFVYSKQLKHLNQQLLKLNQEAAAANAEANKPTVETQQEEVVQNESQPQ